MSDCAVAGEFLYALVAGYPGLQGKRTMTPGDGNAPGERGCVPRWPHASRIAGRAISDHLPGCPKSRTWFALQRVASRTTTFACRSAVQMSVW